MKASIKKQRNESPDCSRISGVFKFLSHPERVQLLLCLMANDDLSVMDLVARTKMSQSQVSQTLQKLKLSGIVDAERHGTSVHYHLRCPQFRELLKHISEIYF